MVSTSEPKVTLGQQIIDTHVKYAGQKTQTVRETTDEMSKSYLKNLWDLVEANKHITKDWYITEILRVDPFLDNAMHIHLRPRLTRPLPEWGLALHKVNVTTGEIIYQWGLPHLHEAEVIMENPEGWDSKIVKDIRDHVEGK